MNCLICGESAEIHHIKSRGSGGTDDSWNCVPFCRIHHTEIHRIGNYKMASKYVLFDDFLLRNGWELVKVFGVWKLKRI